MWPFAGMSLFAATLIGSIANWALLVCLLGGVIATFVIVQTADVKEEHWDEDRRHSNERIAELTAQAETARKETAQARLEIQRLKNPRTITPDALEAELVGKPKGKAAILYVKECSDCEWLAFWLISGLRQSGWELANSAPMPLPPAPINSVPSSPTTSAGGQPWGVSVVANTNADGSAQSALMWALTNLLGENGHGGIDKTLSDGLIRVIVARGHNSVRPRKEAQLQPR